MTTQMIVFLIFSTISVFGIVFVVYSISTKHTPVIKKEFVDDRSYTLDDKSSANAQLFGLNKESDEDLEKTKAFTPITQKVLEEYYHAEGNLFDDDISGLPKLK